MLYACFQWFPAGDHSQWATEMSGNHVHSPEHQFLIRFLWEILKYKFPRSNECYGDWSADDRWYDIWYGLIQCWCNESPAFPLSHLSIETLGIQYYILWQMSDIEFWEIRLWCPYFGSLYFLWDWFCLVIHEFNQVNNLIFNHSRVSILTNIQFLKDIM